MPEKSHLKFLSEKQISEIKDFHYNYGFDSSKEEEEAVPKNYFRLATSFRRDLERLDADIDSKYKARDVSLEIPYDIDYIQITFQDTFSIKNTWERYFNEFGLEATAFYDFAKKGLFAIADRGKFQTFITNVHHFIESELEGNQNVQYSNYIKYIAHFKLLRTKDILKFKIENVGDIVYLALIDLPLDNDVKQQLVQSLINYLESNNIIYKYDEEYERIELQNPTSEQIKKIVQNFDIIESVTCSAFTTVRPSDFGTVERLSGFTIQNADDDLPIIGIIDTGIEMQTALAPLIIDDSSFTLAGNPLIDQAGRNRLGHGTAVAALAALGKHNHKNNFEGEVNADAKLLSIKISDSGNGFISEFDLLRMLYDVKAKYPEIRLFTLTSCYGNFMHKNETFFRLHLFSG